MLDYEAKKYLSFDVIFQQELNDCWFELLARVKCCIVQIQIEICLDNVVLCSNERSLLLPRLY